MINFAEIMLEKTHAARERERENTSKFFRGISL